LLKLCAQAAADAAAAADETDNKSLSSLSSSLSSPLSTSKKVPLGCESVIRVGRNVEFDQAIDILERAGRTPDRNYAQELLKVTIQTSIK